MAKLKRGLRMMVARHFDRLALAAMVAMAILAFAIPMLAFRDVPTDVPPIVLRQLHVEARHMTKLPLMFQQVTAATAIGTAPPYGAEGVVVWRTPFGIPIAEIHIFQSQTTVRGGGIGGALAVPTVFVALEAALAWILIRRQR